jgi:hypothetical protein
LVRGTLDAGDEGKAVEQGSSIQKRCFEQGPAITGQQVVEPERNRDFRAEDEVVALAPESLL